MYFIAANFENTTNEIRTPTNDKTMTFKQISQYNYAQEQEVTTRIFFKSTTSLSIAFVTNYVKGIFSLNTQKQMERFTLTVIDEQQNEYILSNSTEMYVYIIPLTGIFIVFIVVLNILFILHRRKMCPNTNSTRRLHITKRSIEIDHNRMSTHITNETDTNNSQYEMINFDSDDAESITCLKFDTSFEPNNQQPTLSTSFISRSNEIIDSDGYQCPISSETREKTISRDTCLNNYLTVV